MEQSVYESFRLQVQPVLSSKLEEFRLLGYDSITETELWEFLIKKKWKKAKDEPKLHQIIQDILTIKVSDFISYAAIESYKSTEFSMDDENEWKELLK
ncbi:post-transcriptional regulator [Neobacillus fumarioli]|uniref:post-transcriptional regulator n=1 Tax=Neobacillus fumarioli TaxID=105229 RepID=UPI00082E282B|nr:post-transcriptional regulator [Neobacillus fumarioli]